MSLLENVSFMLSTKEEKPLFLKICGYTKVKVAEEDLYFI